MVPNAPLASALGREYPPPPKLVMLGNHVGHVNRERDLFAGNVLIATTIGVGGGNFSKENMRQKVFPQNSFQSREHLSCVLHHMLQKDLLQLDRTGHRRVTLPRIHIGRFDECTNISLPFIHDLFDTITFVFFIPGITS